VATTGPPFHRGFLAWLVGHGRERLLPEPGVPAPARFRPRDLIRGWPPLRAAASSMLLARPIACSVLVKSLNVFASPSANTPAVLTQIISNVLVVWPTSRNMYANAMFCGRQTRAAIRT